MFEYTKETILNDVTKASVISELDGSKTLVVKGDGNYKKANVQAVYKVEGVEGSPCKITFAASTIPAEGAEYMVSFKVFSDKKLQEFASPNWQEFTKPVLIEFAAATANEAMAAIGDGLKMILGDYGTFDATSGEFLFNVNWLNVKEVVVGKRDCVAINCSGEMEEQYQNTTDITATVDERVKDFATCAWLIENYRLPTSANLRFNAAFDDERPSAPVYNQYVIKYCTPRHIGGMSVIGQVNSSFTNHVFYVPATDAATFEGYITDLGLTAGTAADNYDGVWQ